MSDVLVAIYLFFFVAVFGATFAFMWRLSGSVLADMDKQPRRRARHPEMQDVNDGEELLVFKKLEDPDDK
jgi:hypothetical protein